MKNEQQVFTLKVVRRGCSRAFIGWGEMRSLQQLERSMRDARIRRVGIRPEAQSQVG